MGKRYEIEVRKMKQVQQDLLREEVIPMCLSPLTGRNNSKKLKVNKQNVHRKPDSVESTQNYLLDCYCANAQSLNNKMDEFREVVAVWKPKFVGITESCSKDRSEGDTDLEGYSQQRGDRGRGVILYIDNKLQSTPCVELNGTDFESSVWNIVYTVL